MYRLILLTVVLTSLSFSVSAQAKTNAVISRQIREAGGERTFSITYDRNSNVSKLMAVSGNFSDGDADKIGAQAMNFAVGFMYPGESLAKAPDTVIFTFWVLTRRPRFTQNHSFSAGGLDLGAARYVSKPRENMEYLNFDITREDLQKIAAATTTRIKLGDYDIQFTGQQVKILRDLLKLSDPSK